MSEEFPPPSQWVTLVEVAKYFRVTYHSARNQMKRGSLSLSGERVWLRHWKTPRGLVTTRQAIEDYLRRLNH